MSDSDHVTEFVVNQIDLLGVAAEEFANHKTPERNVLYHYSDVVGLMGILQLNELWASNVFLMNDETEISYAGDAHGNSPGSLIEIPHPVRAVAGR
jgi:hypothetical protein